MHGATNVLHEVTRNLGAKTKKGFRSRWRTAVSTIAPHHVHAHVRPSAARCYLRSQQVCSPGPNGSALQVPTGLLSKSQQVSSPGPNRSHHQVPTGVVSKSRKVSSLGPKRSHLQRLRILGIACHHFQWLLCLLLCFSGVGVALHQLLFHALILQLQILAPFPLVVQLDLGVRPSRALRLKLLGQPANQCLCLGLGGVRHRLSYCRRDTISEGHTHLLHQGVLAPLYHLVSHSPNVNHSLGLLGLLGLGLR